MWNKSSVTGGTGQRRSEAFGEKTSQNLSWSKTKKRVCARHAFQKGERGEKKKGRDDRKEGKAQQNEGRGKRAHHPVNWYLFEKTKEEARGRLGGLSTN